jgi:hypothetical protein
MSPEEDVTSTAATADEFFTYLALSAFDNGAAGATPPDVPQEVLSETRLWFCPDVVIDEYCSVLAPHDAASQGELLSSAYKRFSVFRTHRAGTRASS